MLGAVATVPEEQIPGRLKDLSITAGRGIYHPRAYFKKEGKAFMLYSSIFSIRLIFTIHAYELRLECWGWDQL